ncbi:MAG: hypothetical protein HY525_12125 [Betaproteobacteria bacterium]|nr:hypothetical protein [Betaproteobacteria bacterium]
MSIKIMFRGVELTADGVSEAAELARALTAEQPHQAPIHPQRQDYIIPPRTTSVPRRKLGRPRKTAEDNKFDDHNHKMAINFLSAIRDAGSHGIDSEKMATVLAVSHSKGIGSKTGRINKLLEKIGYKRSAVYRNDKNEDGERIWKASAQIQAAITAVEDDSIL